MKITESIRIRASQEALFKLSQDYTLRLSWDPFLKVAQLVNAESVSKGVREWCVSKQGMGMETEYVTYDPPRVTAVKMTRGPFMFKSFAGSWSFGETSHDVTEVTFVYSFKLIAPLRLFELPVRAILAREMRGRLMALKRWMESE